MFDSFSYHKDVAYHFKPCMSKLYFFSSLPEDISLHIHSIVCLIRIQSLWKGCLCRREHSFVYHPLWKEFSRFVVSIADVRYLIRFRSVRREWRQELSSWMSISSGELKGIKKECESGMWNV